MAYEIELVIILVFSVSTAIMLTYYALSKKKKLLWSLFILFILSLGFFGWIALFGRDMFGSAPDNRVIPIDLVAMPLLSWIVGMILLSKANHDLKMEQQYNRMLALNEIAKAYLTTSDFEEAAKAALVRLAKYFESDGAIIFIMDQEKRKVSILAEVGKLPKQYDEWVDRLSASFESLSSSIEKYYQGNKEEMIRLRDEGFEILHEQGFRTAFGAPVTVGGKEAAMIIIYARRAIQLSEEDKDSLNLVAFELGLWMAQIASLNRLRKLSEAQKGLLDISLLLQMELDRDKMCHSIISKLTELIPSRDAMLYLYDPIKKVMWATNAIGKDAGAILEEGEFSISDAGLAGAILMSGKAEIISDTIKDGRGKQIDGTSRETTAMLALPLISKGKPLGIIELHRDPPGRFVDEELQLGKLFAQQASIALENTQLLEMMEMEKDRSKLYLDLLSHDIANLNTPLYSYFDMLMRTESTPEAKEILTKAHAQVEAMSALVSRVRKLSKGDLEDMEEIRTVMVSEIVLDAIRILQIAFPNKKIDVEVHIQEDNPFPARAGEMLDEIFNNLLHNAVKFSSGRNVKIEVTVERMEIKGRWLCAVRIADHGSGVPDELKEDIFAGRKAVAASFARGFGIGLNMCRKLVEKYGGSIWVEDRVRGDHTQGACFVVTLPTMSPKKGRPL